MNLAPRCREVLDARVVVEPHADGKVHVPGAVEGDPTAACQIRERTVEPHVGVPDRFLVHPLAGFDASADESVHRYGLI